MAKFNQKMLKNENFIIHSRKKFDDFWLKFWSLSGAKVCESCRSRQELSNEYLLAKIGVDTAENEPLKVWVDLFIIIFSPPYSSVDQSLGVFPTPQGCVRPKPNLNALAGILKPRVCKSQNSKCRPRGPTCGCRPCCCSTWWPATYESSNFFSNFLPIFSKLWEARSRLYRNESLQVNSRWKALDEI